MSPSLAVVELPDNGDTAAAPDAELLLLLPRGAEPDPSTVECAVRLLERDPCIAAVVDLPIQDRPAALLLDLLLRPEDVNALVVRSEILEACDLRALPHQTLASALVAVRVGCTLPVERAEAPLLRSAPEGTVSEQEADLLACEVLSSFALEDLYPELRHPTPPARLHELLQHCALSLIARRRHRAGFAVGSWARALIERRDTGLGLQVAQPRAATPETPSPEGLWREIPPTPLVSLIVPTMNRRELLSRALTSVAAQTFDDLEVIVVNDGGVDPGPALEPFRESIGGGERLTVVHHDRNRGLAATRNTGLRLARGQYVGFLDDDDCLLPHHLAALVPRLRLGAAAAHGDTRSVLETPARPLPLTQRITVHYQESYRPELYRVDNYLPVHSILCERELLQRVGGFDETLPCLEDWDCWLRVFSLCSPVHVPRVTTELRVPTDGSNMSAVASLRWAEVQTHIYGKTLAEERRIPGLREARIRHILSRTQGGPFPTVAERWLRGADGLPPIDPADPLANVLAAELSQQALG